MFYLFIYLFLIFNFFSGSKNDSKNTKILREKMDFLKENFGKIFWLILKKFQPKLLDFGQKQLILQDFWKKI